MPTKKEYEEIFNRALGVDIKWSKLTKEELAQLAVIFSNPSLLMERLGVKAEKEIARRRFVEAGVEVLEDVLGRWEGPLVSIAKRLLGMEKEK